MVVSAIVDDEEIRFLLGSREMKSDELTAYSEKSLLGAAVFGAKIGDKVSYTLPNGKSISVEILGAEFYA
jgi:transcription elongation factor GreA